MTKTMNDIQDIMFRKFNGFNLEFKDPVDVYKNVDCLFARKGYSLYIAVKFPIVPFPRLVSLFTLVTFPVSINDSIDRATQLLNMPDLFAVTDDLQYYTVFQKEELDGCTETKIITCKTNKVLTPVTSNSCIFALFK